MCSAAQPSWAGLGAVVPGELAQHAQRGDLAQRAVRHAAELGADLAHRAAERPLEVHIGPSLAALHPHGEHGPLGGEQAAAGELTVVGGDRRGAGGRRSRASAAGSGPAGCPAAGAGSSEAGRGQRYHDRAGITADSPSSSRAHMPSPSAISARRARPRCRMWTPGCPGAANDSSMPASLPWSSSARSRPRYRNQTVTHSDSQRPRMRPQPSTTIAAASGHRDGQRDRDVPAGQDHQQHAPPGPRRSGRCSDP